MIILQWSQDLQVVINKTQMLPSPDIFDWWNQNKSHYFPTLWLILFLTLFIKMQLLRHINMPFTSLLQVHLPTPPSESNIIYFFDNLLRYVYVQLNNLEEIKSWILFFFLMHFRDHWALLWMSKFAPCLWSKWRNTV